MLERLRSGGHAPAGTVVRDGTPYDRGRPRGPVALVLGNEAHGLPRDVVDAVDEPVTIPMAGRAESLNVAMAGTVLCFEVAPAAAGGTVSRRSTSTCCPTRSCVLDADHVLAALQRGRRSTMPRRTLADRDRGSPSARPFDVRSPVAAPGRCATAGRPPSGEVDLTFRRRRRQPTSPVTVTARRAATVGRCSACRPSGERPSGIDIVSTVTHELRSPLTSVKGYTSLLLNRWDRIKDEQKRTMLEQVHHDADRVTRLVTELLDISRLETGRLVLRRQLVDLAALADVGGREGRPSTYPDLDCTRRLPRRRSRGLRRPRQGRAGAHQPGRERRQVRQPRRACGSSGTVDDDGRSPSRCTTPARASPPRTCPGCSPSSSGATTASPPAPASASGSAGAWSRPTAAGSRPTRDRGQGSTFRFTLPTDAFEQLHGSLANRFGARPPPAGSMQPDHDRRHPSIADRAGAARPIAAAATLDELRAARRRAPGQAVRAVGAARRSSAALDADERRTVGQALNEAATRSSAALAERRRRARGRGPSGSPARGRAARPHRGAAGPPAPGTSTS